MIIKTSNPLDNNVVKIDVFKKNAIVGIKMIKISVRLYLADIEFINIKMPKKSSPMKKIPTSPAAATPSVRKKFALAF